MEAMILAAGEGTRLLPLTRQRPKPLFPILNKPLLQITIEYLGRFGFNRLILNTHHLASQVDDFLHTQINRPGLNINSSFEPEILGTGGGIGQTRTFWQDRSFLAINGDIVTDIDLAKALDYHHHHQGPVTLILHDYPEFNQIATDAQGRIRDFRLPKGKGLAFTGIHIFSRDIYKFLPSTGAYDIIPVYQQMIHQGIPIWAYVSQGHYWRDIGTPKSYLKIHEELLTSPALSTSILKKEFPEKVIPRTSSLDKDAAVSGWACLGEGCRLLEGSSVQNSVLWDNVTVAPGILVSDSIVGREVSISRNVTGEVIV